MYGSTLPPRAGYLGSISAVSRVRPLILPEVRVHFPEQRLVIEPTGYMYVVKVHVAAFWDKRLKIADVHGIDLNKINCCDHF